MVAALFLLYNILPFHNSIVSKTLPSPSTYLTGRLITYIVQKITMAWIAFAQAACRQKFSKLLKLYVIFNYTPNLYQILARKVDGSVSSLLVNALGEYGSVNEQESAAEPWERSATVDEP